MTLRKRVIQETAALAVKTMLDAQKENIASVAVECTAEFKNQLPEILLRAYAGQFLTVLQGALTSNTHPFIDPNDIMQIKARLGMQ